MSDFINDGFRAASIGAEIYFTGKCYGKYYQQMPE